ncbi:MAG: PQQ-binding-like beta-propeller repeat protein [Planctomycetota bacterium]|nr:PQQ-binding-like beta-propeller repeat protein [Planctomycetota bacterium]
MISIHRVKQEVRREVRLTLLGDLNPASNPESELKDRFSSVDLTGFSISRAAFFVFCVLTGFAQTKYLFAQGFFNNNGPAFIEPQLIEPPREMVRLLEEAREQVQQKVWSEATLAAGILLGLEEADLESDWSGQDYFLDVRANVGRQSIRQEAIAVLDSMPEAGQAVIELRYGLRAQQELDSAITNRDWSMISEVSRKYCFTKAGRDAAWLIVEERLGRGLPMDAAVLLENLLKQSRARSHFGAPGMLFLATCWLAADKQELAVAAINSAKAEFPNSKVQWNGTTIDLNTETNTILSEQVASKSITRTSFKTNEPGWVGGDQQRNADTSMGLPVPLTNWKYWMHESIQHEESAYKTVKQKLTDRNTILVPSRVPIVAYPWVIVMSYGQRVNAIHLKTGKMVWGNSFNNIPYDLSMDRFVFREGPTAGIVAQDYLLRRIWGESGIGQLTSDGSNLYCLAELASVDAAESLTLGIHANVSRPIARRNFNCLQALSIADQGKLIWEVGGETGLAEPALAGVLFLGAPIAANGELLTMGELNGEVYLFSVNPSDGRMNWRQQLVANPASPLASDPRRRNQSCVPSIAGGICVCPTLSGQLVGVNLNTRSLAWSLPYSQNSSFASNRINVFGNPTGGDINAMELRSSDSGVLIVGDCVIHAPSDGDTVYAAGLLDGKQRWELSKNSILYVAAGLDDRILLVGDQLLYCVEAADGANAWENPIALNAIGRVVGRGCRNGDHYYVPMSSQEILDIDLRQGKIVDRMRVAQPLGNLVATADQVISLSPVELTAYSIRDRVRDEVDLEFATGNVTSPGLQRKSKIYLAEGDIDSAIDTAEKAYRMDRKDPEVQHLLRYIAMRALQEDFDKHSSRVLEYEDLINAGPERTLYLISVIDGLVKRGESVEVTRKLLELQNDMYQQRFAGPSLSDTIDPENNLTLQNDIWTAAKLAQLYEASNTNARAGMISIVADRIQQLSKSIAAADTETRSDMFRWLPAASSLRLEIAKKVFDGGDLLLAEQLLGEAAQVASASLQRDSSANSSESTEEQKLLQSKMDKLRLAIYNTVGRWTTSVPISSSLGESLDSIRTEPFKAANPNPLMLNRRAKETPSETTVADFKRLSGGLAAWPNGKVTVDSRIADRPLQPILGSTTCPVKQATGTALAGWMVYLQQGAIELVGPTGSQRLTIQAEIIPRGIGPTGTIAHIIDSILLLELPTEIIAIDTLRAAMNNNEVASSNGDYILWRESFSSQLTEEPNRFGGSKLVTERMPWGSDRIKNRRGFAIGPANHYGVIVSQSGSVISLDPRTGTRRWVRSGFGSQLTIGQDDHTLIVLDTTKSERLLIDARDGKLISRHPLTEKWEVWTSAGKNLLTASEEKVSVRDGKASSSTIRFKLIDGISGNVVLEKSFPKDNEIRAEVIAASGTNPACMVAWQANQPLLFWNLKSGKESSYPVPNKFPMRSITLERTGGHILILPESPSLRNDVVQTEEPDRFRKVSGAMLAIDPQDGHPLWKSPVIVYDFRFPIAQVRNTPAIILNRPLKFKANGLINTETVSVAVLDSRTGALLYNDNYLFSTRGGADFQCLSRLGDGEVTFQYRGSEVLIKWSNKTPDDQPDAQANVQKKADTNPEKDPLKESETDATREIGKFDKKSIQSGVPAKLLERLQSGDNPDDPLGRPADYDQLFQQKEDQ